MNSIVNLSAKQLRKAASLKDKIASLQKELSRISGNATPSPAGGPREKRKMSKAARARIATAARARWAKVKKAGRKRL